MRFLLTADLHIDTHKGDVRRLDDGLDVLEWVCQTAIERQCDYVVCCGDLFQHRQKIQVLVYQKVFQLFQKYSSQIKWKLLLGNHDMFFHEKWDISSVIPLSSIPNVEVIDRPCSTKIGTTWFDWLPYVKNPIQSVHEFFPEERQGRILCGHIAVDKAQQGTCGHVSDVSVEYEGDMVKVDSSAFAGWRHVFLGHYHLAQFLDERMQYLGSPYQINFSEANHTPHIVLLDTDYMTLEYIENTFSPRHLIIDESELGTVDIVNNFIQVKGNLTKFDVFELQKVLSEENVRSLEFRAVSLHEHANDIKEKFDLAEGQAFEKYIDAMNDNHLNRELLKNVVMEIIHASSEK